jgi:hypothetical protein
MTSATVLFTILIVTDRLSDARNFVENDANILQNEHPDVAAEIGTQWLEGIKVVLDIFSGSKTTQTTSYPLQLACREIHGFSIMIGKKYKVLDDKGLIDRAERLAAIAEGLF